MGRRGECRSQERRRCPVPETSPLSFSPNLWGPTQQPAHQAAPQALVLHLPGLGGAGGFEPQVPTKKFPCFLLSLLLPTPPPPPYSPQPVSQLPGLVLFTFSLSSLLCYREPQWQHVSKHVCVCDCALYSSLKLAGMYYC